MNGRSPILKGPRLRAAVHRRDALDRRRFLGRSVAAALAWVGPHAFAVDAPDDSAGAPNLLTTGVPSRTARGAALHRAVHQIVDHPRVFDDPHAVRILEPFAPGELQSLVDRRGRGMRASIVLRSRYTEDCLAEAVARGTRQYVVLGAGFDTFACRNPHLAAGLQVYEVDHPATQADKRRRIQAAGLAPRAGTHFVPIDFERQTLSEALPRAGFRFERPAFFSMLGVSIYISDAAVMATLRTVAACVPGSEISMSFSIPDALLNPAARAYRQRSIAAMAAAGEPWTTFYDPDELTVRLLQAGFASAQPLRPPEANRRYFVGRNDGLAVADAHMMLARV